MRLLAFTHERFELIRQLAIPCVRLWHDEDGAILSSELLLVSTLLVVGLVAGLDATRTAILTELADVSAAVGTMNQSFSIGGTFSESGASTAGSQFVDAIDQGDPTQQVGKFGPLASQGNSCIVICTTALGER
ncbi:MAG: hypothetical protein KF708_19630 [Pirellulales bacterium]|nr:hypothetical protein [Pirellulales bacterium]